MAVTQDPSVAVTQDASVAVTQDPSVAVTQDASVAVTQEPFSYTRSLPVLESRDMFWTIKEEK